MEIASLPVDDGSSLVLVGTTPDEQPDDVSPEAPVLGSVADFLHQILVDGALIGITGNASYDLLKILRAQLQERGILTRKPAAGLDEVRDRMTEALARTGHPGATYTEITQHADKGWEARGTVAAGTFSVRADPEGQVLHLRIL